MILRAEAVTKYYGAFCALDAVSFGVDPGQFVSIIGPNGAGKTTLINVLTGLARPTGGRVYFQGGEVTGLGPGRLARMGLVRSFQLVQVFPELTVLETLQVAVVSRLGRGRRWWAALERDREVTGQALAVAELFGLAGKRDTPAKHLPQGDKKLLDVATAFALAPQVILLDEPTSGVSTSDKHQVMETLVAAARRVGIRAVVQVEHDMDIVFTYSDRIIVLHQGRILADGAPERIRADEAVVSTVLGRRGPAAGVAGRRAP